MFRSSSRLPCDAIARLSRTCSEPTDLAHIVTLRAVMPEVSLGCCHRLGRGPRKGRAAAWRNVLAWAAGRLWLWARAGTRYARARGVRRRAASGCAEVVPPVISAHHVARGGSGRYRPGRRRPPPVRPTSPVFVSGRRPCEPGPWAGTPVDGHHAVRRSWPPPPVGGRPCGRVAPCRGVPRPVGNHRGGHDPWPRTRPLVEVSAIVTRPLGASIHRRLLRLRRGRRCRSWWPGSPAECREPSLLRFRDHGRAEEQNRPRRGLALVRRYLQPAGVIEQISNLLSIRWLDDLQTLEEEGPVHESA